MRMTYDDFVKEYSPRIDAAYRKAHGVTPATSDYAHNAWRLLREGWGIDAVLADIAGQPYTDGPGSHPDEMLPPEGEQSAVVPLRVDGRIFRTADGAPWRWRGVSAFALLARYARGEDISDFLNAYQGYNVLRVWPYVPVADWGDRAWSVTGVQEIRSFVADMNARGWYVELTLLTDGSSDRLAWAKALVPQLSGLPGLFVELGNEPLTHKQIDTPALRGAVESTGLLYASGDYEDSARAFGSYLVAHTSRDREWVRRAHDALEYFGGGGPNSPSDPAHRVPVVLDEPPKLQDVGASADDWRAYFGAAALLAAGATFHSESGKFALPPTPDEAVLAKAALEALNAFPADAPLGGYVHDTDDEHATGSLRSYRVGPYGVRMRPQHGEPILWGGR